MPRVLRICLAAAAIACLAAPLPAQQAQNPSPMVEHTRAHRRLNERVPPGRREALALGTLFVPDGLVHKGARRVPLLVFFHGGTWLPEVAAAQARTALIGIQLGAGSGSYAAAFEDPATFPALLHEAAQKVGVAFRPITLGGWSAGCGAIRQLLGQPDAYARIDRVLAIDGIHAGYVNGKPGPLESDLEAANLQAWLRLGRDAMAARKGLTITHSEIFPGTFASTTETADYLARALGVALRPVLKWGPGGMQQVSEARAGRLRILGFAGNSAPDHVDQLHALPDLLQMF